VVAEYSDAVLQALRASKGSGVIAGRHLEGLIALFEGRIDDGLQAARETAARYPWFHDAHILSSDLFVARGRLARDQGRWEDALADFTAAVAEADAASAIGRSDPRAYEAKCGAWIDIVLVRQQRSGEEAADAVGHAMAACADALVAEPRRAMPLVQQAVAQRLLGSARQARGLDATDSLSLAEGLARRALALTPPLALASETLGAVLVEQARVAFSRGQDPRPLLAQAVAALETAANREGSRASIHDWIGSAWRLRAWFEWARGLDPIPSWDQAARAYSSAVSIDETSPSYCNDLARVFATRASYEVAHGMEAGVDLERATKGYARCLARSSQLADTWAGLGTASFTRAEDALQQDVDPAPHVDEAVRALERATSLNGQSDYAFFALGYSWLLRAEYLVRHGLPATSALQDAGKCLETAVQINPANAFAHAQLANLWSVRARAAVASERKAALNAGRRSAASALLHDPTLSDAHLSAARLEIEAARGEKPDSRERDADLAAAARGLDRAAASNPGDARIFCARAELATVAAASRTGVEARRTAQAGLDAATRAIQLNPRLAVARDLAARLSKMAGRS
jgi:eukaryotic-like serine/threonine-protein kinase